MATVSTQVPSTPVMARLTLSAEPVRRLDVGIIESVSELVVTRRLRIAQELVAVTPPSVDQSPDPTLWAVGFGCDSLPKAPNPHAGYGWS